jgi:hypothetical protein
MLNSAPKLHKFHMCDFLVEIAISETYFKFWPLKFRLTSTTRRDRMFPNHQKRKKTCPQNRLKNTRCKGVHVYLWYDVYHEDSIPDVLRLSSQLDILINVIPREYMACPISLSARRARQISCMTRGSSLAVAKPRTLATEVGKLGQLKMTISARSA